MPRPIIHGGLNLSKRLDEGDSLVSTSKALSGGAKQSCTNKVSQGKHAPPRLCPLRQSQEGCVTV